MLKTYHLLLAGLVWSSFRPIVAQPLSAAGQVRYSVEIGGLAANPQQNPFWLRTNQYGTVPLKGSFGTARFGILRDYKPRPDSAPKTRRSRFDWGFGVYAVANAGPTPTPDDPALLLPDAYAKIQFGRVELFAGNRREVYGLGDTLLTSGFVAWSGNALSFPKIQFHTPDYVAIGFTRNLVAFRVGYAHGWLTNAYIQGSYLHQKYLYGRFGKPTWRVRFYAGLNHQVQWGGRADYLINTDLSVDGTLPTSFRDYLSLITGRYPDDIQNGRFTSFDGTNRVGNHVGSYDFALEWNGVHHQWRLYHQHIYEDASGLAFQNVPDGLTGLQYVNRSTRPVGFRVARAVVELLGTMNQSGSTFDITARYQGGDNYFNNSQYIQGWSYRGHTIGTPLIAPRTAFSQTVNDFTGGGYYPDNRLVAYYAGLQGVFRRGPTVMLRASYSRNYGTYNQPYPSPFPQFSGLLSAQWPFGGTKRTLLTTTVALDRGQLFPNSTGGFVLLQRRW